MTRQARKGWRFFSEKINEQIFVGGIGGVLVRIAGDGR
jgi:hypothetical protein